MVITSATRRGGRLALGAALVLAVFWVLPGCGSGAASSAAQGSGVAATQTRVVPRFSSVELAGDNKVDVVVGGPQSVVVQADSNLLGHITTRVVAGTLVIADTGSYTVKTPMSVQVSVPSLAAVKLSGDGMISVTGIKAQQLSVAVPGAGRMYASGTAAHLDVTLDGDGEAELNDLSASQVYAVLAGSGLIRVNATTSLDASVPGTGAIMYSGNPAQVTTSVTGTGTITPG